MCVQVFANFFVLFLYIIPRSVIGGFSCLAIKQVKWPDHSLFCLKMIFQNISTII